MNHLLRKTEHNRSPEHPERRSAEQENSANIAEYMHQPKTIDSEHEHQQDGHKAKTAVDHELRQFCSRQTQHIPYGQTIRHTLRMVERENRLIIGSRKQETDIRKQSNHREQRQQHTEDHPRPAVQKEIPYRLQPVRTLHTNRTFRHRIRLYTIFQFSTCSGHSTHKLACKITNNNRESKMKN